MFGSLHLGDFAAAAASLITIFSLVALLFKGAQYLLSAPARLRAYFFRPKYIIIPTSVELAQYCIKSFDGRRPSEQEVVEERWYRIIRAYKWRRNVTASRINILWSSFIMVFIIFLARLFYFGVIPSNDFRPAVVLSIIAVIYTSMLILLIYLFMRDPPKSQNFVRALGHWLLKM
jgi:hypothetical protein